MKRLILVWILALFLLAIPPVFGAVTVFNNDLSTYAAGTAATDNNFTFTGTSSTYSGSGEVYVKNSADEMWFTGFNLSVDTNYSIYVNWSIDIGTNQYWAMDAYNETVPITSADDTSFVISREDANDATKLTIKNRDDTSILAFGGYNHFFEMNLTINRSSRQVCVSVNNTAVGCIDSHAPGATANHEPFHLSFGSHKYFAGGNGLQVNISSFVIINLSLQEAATDTTPP